MFLTLIQVLTTTALARLPSLSHIVHSWHLILSRRDRSNFIGILQKSVRCRGYHTGDLWYTGGWIARITGSSPGLRSSGSECLCYEPGMIENALHGFPHHC